MKYYLQTTQSYGVGKLFDLTISWKEAVKDQSKGKISPKTGLGGKTPKNQS